MPLSRWTKLLQKNYQAGHKFIYPLRPAVRVERPSVIKHLAFFILAAGIVYLIFFSSIFNINEVVVSGYDVISRERVEDAVRKTKEMKRWLIFSQSNILFFDNAALAALLSDNRLDSLAVKKRRGVLHVLITEKRAAAIWFNQNHWFEIDEQGSVIAEIGIDRVEKEHAALAALTNSRAIAATHEAESVITRDDLGIINSIQKKFPSELNLAISLYDISDLANGRIIARTDKGWDIYFSRRADPNYELNKLRAFAADKDRNDKNWRTDISYIDLRFGSTRIYYK